MRASLRTCLVVIVLLVRADSIAMSQWNIISPFIPTGMGSSTGSALYYENGILWLGTTSIWYSTDRGITWQNPNVFPYGECFDINFFDSLHGLIATSEGLFQTTNGGENWKMIFNGSYVKTAFLGSLSTIGVLDQNTGFYFSSDTGKNWQQSLAYDNMESYSFALAPDGTLYLNSGTWPTQTGSTKISTDRGQTWKNEETDVDVDAWSLAVDSCDSKRLYDADEQYWAWTSGMNGDGHSKLLLSTDGGQSWNIENEFPVPFFSGTLVNSAHAVYAGSMTAQGVFRSIDHGITWNSIGGPFVSQDSRTITALDDNTLFALDTNGNIWGTMNSGGDSVFFTSGTLAFSPDTLFQADTIYCDSVIRTLHIARPECSVDSVLSMQLTGPDANDYAIASNGNSFQIALKASAQGAKHAELHFSVSDGTFDTITLGGYVSAPKPLSMSTGDASTDTIGQEVIVPIILAGFSHAETISLILHYDPALDYVGSFDTSNNRIDVPGSQSQGRSELLIPNAYSGTIGYAHFLLFYDPEKRVATFDSVSIVSRVSPCEYTLPSAAFSTITSPSGCGTDILSQFIRTGSIPNFSIRPNPVSGEAVLTSSRDVSTEITVYDMLGAVREQFSASFSNGNSVPISVPDANGIYYLRIESEYGVSNLRMVVNK